MINPDIIRQTKDYDVLNITTNLSPEDKELFCAILSDELATNEFNSTLLGGLYRLSLVFDIKRKKRHYKKKGN